MVLVSLGDPQGIGYQALLNFSQLFSTLEKKQLNDLVVVGDLFLPNIDEIQSNFLIIENPKDIPNKRNKPVFLVLEKNKSNINQLSDAECGYRSYKYFEYCLNYIKESSQINNISLVTLPVSKKNIIDAGINFAGHTEVLGEFFKRHVYMCMYHPKLKVIPLTHHIPLIDVAKQIKKINFEQLAIVTQKFKISMNDERPAVVAGVNPHAGEGGRIGHEDTFITNELAKVNQKYSAEILQGPIAADSIFSPRLINNYSLIFTCYHDQGLIPFKMLYSNTGLNITLNLPILRVSPDHGPAFEAVASNTADYQNIETAILFALEKGHENWVNL